MKINYLTTIRRIFSYISTAYAIFAFIRDEFLSEELAQNLKLGNLIGRNLSMDSFSWFWFLLLGVVLYIPEIKSFFTNNKIKLIRQKGNGTLEFKIRKIGYELYIDVRNRSWFVDISRIRFVFNYLNADKELISDTLEWLQDSNKNGETYLGKRKTKTIHFATINQLQKTYDIHLSKTNLNNPFTNDRTIQIAVEGLTLSGAKKYLKKDINGILLLLEVVSKGVLGFEIGTYHGMRAE